MDKKSEDNVEFGMIPYNASAPTEEMKLRGVSKESIKGSFEFDVVFTTNKIPGFVVQYIRKTITYRNHPGSSWNTRDYNYWEIFYIGAGGESSNADRFAQEELSLASEGCLIQIGYAYFFPYAAPVKMAAGGSMVITKTLEKIFGGKMAPSIPYANGLPSSDRQPEMKGVVPLESAIIHKLTADWGPHVEKAIPMPSAGWNTIVDEEVFSGPVIFAAFPWDYAGKRPLLKTEEEKGILSRRDWKSATVTPSRGQHWRAQDWLPPPLRCPLCAESHERENWDSYHPGETPPSQFKKMP